jgi:hypothetical protein
MCRILVVCNNVDELSEIRKSILLYDDGASLVIADNAEMACEVPAYSYDAAVVDTGAFDSDEDAITLAKHLSAAKGGFAAVALLANQRFVNRHGVETMLKTKKEGGIAEIPVFLALADPANLASLLERNRIGSDSSLQPFRR